MTKFSALLASYVLGATVGNALPSGHFTRATALEDCLSKAVGGDAGRAQFQSESDFATDSRAYNLNFAYKPAAVMYPNDSAEVAAIVACASDNKVKVQARAGGHDYTSKGLGGADGAVVVDVKNLNAVSVDSSTGIAKVGPGNRLKDTAEKLSANGGRYMPHGSSPTVGMGGHATVGGLGLHSRVLGMAIDVMTGATVVLANGTIVQASATENSDLFWAIRGAGASFGIVTEFRFQTQPEPKEVVNFAYTISSTEPKVISEAFKAYHQISVDKNLDNKLSAAAVISKNVLLISGAYFGSEADFKKSEFKSRIPGITAEETVTGLTWMGHMSRTFEGIKNIFPEQSYFYAKDSAITYSNLPSNETIDSTINHIQTAEAGSDDWFALIDLYGGAINKVAADATAYPHRDAAYFFALYVRTPSATGTTSYEFVDKAVSTFQNNQADKFLSYAGYTNLRLGSNPQQKYWGSNYARLQTIKAAVDPNDIFSTAQGVKAN